MDVEWAGGVPTRIALHAGRSGELRVSSELFTGRFRLVDARTGRDVPFRRDGRTIAFRSAGNRDYVALPAASG